MVATSERSEWTRQLVVSMRIASPCTAFDCASRGEASHSDDHEPTSLQPTSMGTIAAFFVFSITA